MNRAMSRGAIRRRDKWFNTGRLLASWGQAPKLDNDIAICGLEVRLSNVDAGCFVGPQYGAGLFRHGLFSWA